MRRKIRKLVSLLLFLLIVYIGYMSIYNPDELKTIFSNVSIKIFNKNIFIDENEQLNDYAIIHDSDSKNKDYSNSVMYPYYELLNDNQKNVYSLLLNKVNDLEEDIPIYTNINKEEVTEIIDALLSDRPEIFWLSNKFSYTYDIDSNLITNIKLSYLFNKAEINKNKELIDNEVNKIIDKVKDKKLDYEKEKIVHDELAKLIKYDESTQDDQSIYGALVNKKSVCAGYVKSFQYIMMKLGIPTYYISGYADEDHAWNLIELEDGFYNVDLTWDDQDNRIIYKYFNVSDDLIDEDHQREGLSKKITDAKGEKYLNIYTTLK